MYFFSYTEDFVKRLHNIQSKQIPIYTRYTYNIKIKYSIS